MLTAQEYLEKVLTEHNGVYARQLHQCEKVVKDKLEDVSFTELPSLLKITVFLDEPPLPELTFTLKELGYCGFSYRPFESNGTHNGGFLYSFIVPLPDGDKTSTSNENSSL